MDNPLRLLLIAGARPNFMKVAPLIHAVQAHNRRIDSSGRPVECRLVHTGQHYDANMSDVFFRELGIPRPDYSLEVGSGSHAAQTAQVMIRFEPVCLEYRPDWVVVVGDVNSTVACALVAAKLGIKVAHVEAGLRSFDRSMPEEINRVVTDSISDLLLTPSRDGNENLRREGVAEARVRLVGNIMIDALVANLDQARQSQVLDRAGLSAGSFAYVTLHRPSNVDQPAVLGRIMSALYALAREIPVIFPMHPRTRKMLGDSGFAEAAQNGVKIAEPVGYHDSLHLAEKARLVVTDSGGLQEETTYFRTPCLTLRPNTERPVTILDGSNRLTTCERLPEDIRAALNGGARQGRVPELWDGHTAERILAALFDGVVSSAGPSRS